MTPRGRTFTQAAARELAEEDSLILLCGHYEGMDERAVELIKPDEISLGDFVLTGGELAAMAVIDAVARLVPGVLGNGGSAADESFSNGLLEYPQYTRPAVFMGLPVPEVLLSGHHERIKAWRREKALEATRLRRAEMLSRAESRGPRTEIVTGR
jgi:tRNA (guanine37-N1)-methyltransferase